MWLQVWIARVSMFIYLVQHGEAKSEKEDPERGLTASGVEEVRKVAGYAKRMGLRVSGIFHSPKTRARETAKLFAEVLKPERGIDQSDNLLPMDDPALWALRLTGMNEDIMLVGHLPCLARVAGLLLCGDDARTLVRFRMGGIVCLERLETGWAVASMIVPEMAA
jgi:phosphohistidine phosphatase